MNRSYKNTLTNLKKGVYIQKNLVLLFEINKIITTSYNVILTNKMTMNERFNMWKYKQRQKDGNYPQVIQGKLKLTKLIN